MPAVVNHMRLSKPLEENIIERMNSELMANIAKMPGIDNALCVHVSEDGIVVIVLCDSADSWNEYIKRSAAMGWRNLTPYIARTDRKVGPMIVRPHRQPTAVCAQLRVRPRVIVVGAGPAGKPEASGPTAHPNSTTDVGLVLDGGARCPTKSC